MIRLAKGAVIAAKVLALLWVGLLLLGLFGKLVRFVRDEGLLSGFWAWADWFDPMNPLTVAVHVVELLPALVLFWLASRGERWVSGRTVPVSK